MGKAAFGRRRGWRCTLWCVSCACAGTWPRLWLQVRTLGRARSRCHRRDGRMPPELRSGKEGTYRDNFHSEHWETLLSHQMLWCYDTDNPPFVNVSALLICPSGGENVWRDPKWLSVHWLHVQCHQTHHTTSLSSFYLHLLLGSGTCDFWTWFSSRIDPAGKWILCIFLCIYH